MDKMRQMEMSDAIKKAKKEQPKYSGKKRLFLPGARKVMVTA